MCSATSYTVHADNSGTAFTYDANWALITDDGAGTYTLTIDTTVDLTLIDNESTVTIPMYVKSTLDDYTTWTREQYTLINVQIDASACNCASLGWVDPTPTIILANSIMAGTGSVSRSLVAAEADYAARSTDAAFDKCYLSGGAGCVETGAFDSLQSNDGSTTGSIPAWVTFTSSGTKTQSIDINPPDGTASGTYTIVATFNPTNGADYVYNALTFTVECEVTSFTDPSPPSTQAYTIFEIPTTYAIPDSPYTQVPACGYTYTTVYTWAGMPASGFINEPIAGSGEIFVSSADTNDAGTHSISYTAVVTLDSNGPGTTLIFTQSTPIGFDVVATDPCGASTMDTITIEDLNNANAATSFVTIADGNSISARYQVTSPTFSLGTTYSNQAICGDITVEVFSDNDGSDTAPLSNWVSVVDNGGNK